MTPCDLCGKPTKERIITSKKPDTLGNKYTVLQCLGGCMNGKYAYTFFPPRDNGSAGGAPVTRAAAANAPVQQPKTQGPTTANLMLEELTEIRKLMQKLVELKGGGVGVTSREMAPDEDLPPDFM